MKNQQNLIDRPDVALIGGGIMSATLGVMLKHLNPELTIQVIEALPHVALESSHAWHNAGTGHAALCELNYTPQHSDGAIDTTKAIAINERFETSKHFWGYLAEQGIITEPQDLIRPIPHISFVRGIENQEFLRRRHTALTKCHLFETMDYTTDHCVIEQWAPLLLQGRSGQEPLAATRVTAGTDINYGALTRRLIEHLLTLDHVALALQTRVTDIQRQRNGRWRLRLDQGQSISAKFVFIGAGGRALPLLQKSGIPESRGYGGFPVSGQFLLCRNESITAQHAAKVYGQAAVGAPPISVPHLDARVIDGKNILLFGPFAGFSPKFLKSGSRLDLLKSIKPNNIAPLLAAGRDNLALTRYLIRECLKRHEDRCASLREFFPAAENRDWQRLIAGQRVQIIKRDPQRTGRLAFGTEVVAAADGSLAAVLGASPGASVSVSIIVDLLEKCFPCEMASDSWKRQLARMVPAYGIRLSQDRDLYTELNNKATQRLHLDNHRDLCPL